MSPSGLGGSGGGCIIRERGDWREAARLPALSPGENSKFGGYRRGLLMSTAKIFCRFYVSFFDIFLLEGMVTGGDTEPQICSISISRRLRPQIGDDWRMAKSSCNCLFCRCHVFCPPVIAVLKNSHNLLYRDTLNGRCRGNPRGDSLGDSYANYIAVAGSAGSLLSRTRRRGGSGRHAARG